MKEIDDVFEYFKDYFKSLSSLTDDEWSTFRNAVMKKLDENEADEHGNYGFITIFKNNDIEIKVNHEGKKRGGMFIMGVNDPEETEKLMIRLTATCLHDTYRLKMEYLGCTIHHNISQSSSKCFDYLDDAIKYLKELSGYKE